MKIQVGQILLERYRVDGFIASGGMGSVYYVWDLKRSAALAMKVLRSDLAEDPSIFKKFDREAKALKKLTHPNIIPFYGLHRIGDDVVFLLEHYVSGASLADVLRKNKGTPLPVQDILVYLKAICSALGYAHANGVIHCDVKPGNMLIDEGGRIYLTDFGVARHSDSNTTTLAAAGTPAYMAPEQILGEPVKPATDVYALGVMLFEMITGQRPFRGGSNESYKSGTTIHERVRYEHLSLPAPDPRTINPSISPRLSDVILKTLEKNASQRYSSTSAFFADVCDAIGVQSVDIPDRVTVRFPTPPQVSQSVVAAESSPSQISKPKAIFPHISKSVIGLLFFLMLVFAGILLRLSITGTPSTWSFSAMQCALIALIPLLLYGTYYVVPRLLLKIYSFYESISLNLRQAAESKAQAKHLLSLEESKKEEEANRSLLKNSGFEYILPIDKAYEDVQDEIFLGRDKELRQFIQHLYSARGGAFCLSGFRGVGKTKFLNRAIDLLRSRAKDSDDKLLVDIRLILPQSCTSKELMFMITEKLIRRLRELNIFRKLGRNLQNQLLLILKRLSKTIKSTSTKNVEIGGTLRDVINPVIFLGKQDEEEFLPYEASLAQQDVVSVLKSINSLSLTYKFKKITPRIMFVFDEMDKIEEVDDLAKMLKSLKTLFNESDTTFVFVLESEQFKSMFADENEGFVSKFDMYIPCLWEKAENIFNPVVKGNGEYLSDGSIFLYQNFLKYLSFSCRGIPRRLWKIVRKHTFEEGSSTFLGFSNKDIRKFKFYSEMENWLSQEMNSFLLNKTDFSDLDLDLFKMSVYTLLDSVFRSSEEWFGINDILTAFKDNKKSFFYFPPDFVGSFLDDLTRNEYLEKRGNKYKILHRRYVELGGAQDDLLLTGDFRIKGSFSSEVSGHDLDEDKTELGNYKNLTAPKSTSWVLLAESTDNKLIFRLNDQACALIKADAIYEKCDIGRASNNDVELSDEEASRYHARLIHSTLGWQIIDMNTANGTFVDGVPISQAKTLVSGSIITIGNTNIFFKVIS